jgi:nitrate reductase (cytochrome), electron transfer subunit
MRPTAIIKTLLTPLLAALLAAAPLGLHAEDTVQSLRGADVQAPDAETVTPKLIVDRAPVKRNYAQQPPVIPHEVDDYKITNTSNRCLDCHSWSDAEEGGPTKVSRTHFKDQSSTDDANLSQRRHFCIQCHVPQTDAKPVVENSFMPATALK